MALWIEVLLGMISERKSLECCQNWWHVPIEQVFAWAEAVAQDSGTVGRRDANTIWGFCADVRSRSRVGGSFSVDLNLVLEPWSFLYLSTHGL